MSDYFSGRVHTVVFSNEDQSFYILRMLIDGSDKLETVRGTVPGLSVREGTWFGFDAVWESHSKYGPQLKITKAPVMKTGWTPETATEALSSHGIATSLVNKVRLHYGDDDFIESLGDLEKIKQVEGVTDFAAELIVDRWNTARALFKTVNFLTELDLPKVKVDKVWAKFGDETERIISENPWSLVEIEGVSFSHADEIARKMGLDPSSIERVKGAILENLSESSREGHVYQDAQGLTYGVKKLCPGVSNKEIADGVKALHTEGRVVVDKEEGEVALYVPTRHNMEVQCARILIDRVHTACLKGEALEAYEGRLGAVGERSQEALEAKKSLDEIVEAALDDWFSTSKFELTATQRKGALNALTQPVSILTGLPGTGKTSTLRTVVKLLQDMGEEFLLVAPTGIAAKRLKSVTGADASTIHRALGAKGASDDDDREATYAGVVGDSSDKRSEEGWDVWSFSEDEPHPAKVVIVDESSMVDLHLLYRLLCCTASATRLVFVGDAAQLPSVGPGNVLRDLVDSGVFPTVALKDIFRQKDTSDIVIAAHAIHEGRVPSFEEESKDFRVVHIRDEGEILRGILNVTSKLHDEGKNFQVLSPRHKGTLGVTNLNVALRDQLNPMAPGVKQMRFNSEVLREGDRVMIAKNSYRYEIFNGDVGKVVSINKDKSEVEIKIWGPPVTHVRLPFKEAARFLRMAYTVTVHKSQGQEYDFIVIPWVASFKNQLQRNLIYTAITRAKKKVIILGHPRALEISVKRSEVDKRNTRLPSRLRREVGGRT